MRKTINDNDFLGRASYRSREEKKARSGYIMPDIFLERKGNNLLSVDRFDFCPLEELTDIQDKNAKMRSTETVQRSFYGWAKITAEIARKNGRNVRSTFSKGNPYHADIVLPKDINRDDEEEHALELASNAEWVPRFNKQRKSPTFWNHLKIW